VIFSSTATNLTTSGTFGIFVHDRDADTDGVFDEPGAIATVQVDSMVPLVPSMSGDARFVSFGAFSDVPALGDTNGSPDIVIQDTCRGVAAGCTPQTALASVASDGTQGDDQSVQHTLSPDGRFVVLDSDATNLVANDANGVRDVFWRDTCFGVTTACTPSTLRVSVASDGSEANGTAVMTRFGMYGVSQGGRLVVFASSATNLVAGDTNGGGDIFVRDTCFGATGCTPSTVRVSVASDGSEGNAGVSSTGFSMSADGTVVAFASLASNMVPGDTNSASDIFLANTGFGAGGGGGGNPVPVIVSLTPSNATEGGPAFTLTVDGTDFLASSVVRWDGSDRTTTFVSSVQLTADIPASDIATAGTANVTVFNPTPGGGTSNGDHHDNAQHGDGGRRRLHAHGGRHGLHQFLRRASRWHQPNDGLHRGHPTGSDCAGW
jgi:hypothetical protein